MSTKPNQGNKNRRGASSRGGRNSGKLNKAQKGRSKFIDYKDRQKKGDPLPKFNDDAIRLNKFLSNAGICSRREADVLIQTGLVKINGEIITEMGYKVKPGDVVKYDGQTINPETKRYILLNKPKGFSLSNTDIGSKNSVFSLVKKASKEITYPIGKMDKDATGLILFTNDSDLMKKMVHPQHKPERLYHVFINKRMSREHLKQMLEGVTLEDGTVQFTQAEFVEDGDGFEIGIGVISSKSQIVKRALESLGYVVTKLDRVKFAGLTKKDLPRGMFRHLTEKEVGFLKMK